MNVEQYLIAKLAEVMWANSLDKNEAIAIGCVIRNRAKETGWWEQLKTTIVFENTMLEYIEPRFIECLWDAENIFYNRTNDITEGSTWSSKTPWADRENHKIGSLYFIKF